MKILFIDATKREEIFVELELDEVKYRKVVEDEKSENILSSIDKILKKNKVGLKDLNEIKVNPGPGSFTGIRVGISMANPRAFAIEIPTLIPVKEPGPGFTFISFRSLSPTLFFFKILSIEDNIFSDFSSSTTFLYFTSSNSKSTKISSLFVASINIIFIY